jgi:hypothetical protein
MLFIHSKIRILLEKSKKKSRNFIEGGEIDREQVIGNREEGGGIYGEEKKTN